MTTDNTVIIMIYVIVWLAGELLNNTLSVRSHEATKAQSFTKNAFSWVSYQVPLHVFLSATSCLGALVARGVAIKQKSLTDFSMRLFDKKRQRLTLPRFTVVPSALVGLTSLFGMGRGDPHRYSHLKVITDNLLLSGSPAFRFTAIGRCNIIWHVMSFSWHE